MSIVDAIFAQTGDARERATMLYACGAESGCQPISQIGGGPGRGYFQIETGQGVSEACANDPYCAVNAFYNGWNVRGCTEQQGQLWQTDPAQAAYLAARCAEGGGSTAANNIGAPYGASQQQTGASFAKLSIPIISGAGDIISRIDRSLNNIPGVGNGTPSSQIDNVSLTPAGQLAAFALGALKSGDLWIRVILIAGGVMMALIGVENLLHIEATPVPVPV